MRREMSEWIRALAGCAVLPAMIVSALGGDTQMQTVFAAFGATYGGLWISHP